MSEEIKKSEDLKISVTLYSGEVVIIDPMKITIAEWKKALKRDSTDQDEYEIVAKATGKTIEQLSAMALPDYRLIADAFVRAGAQPLTNPT